MHDADQNGAGDLRMPMFDRQLVCDAAGFVAGLVRNDLQ
jgi:hypothetical protein